jgi:DNA-binding MarR family transcriptional regulator
MTERDGVDLILEQWRRERPELDPSPIGVIGRISRLARELEQRLEPVYRAHGLEAGWYDVLATLRRAGPPFRVRPTELTGALMLTSSGTTKRLDRLEQAGSSTREPDPRTAAARSSPSRPRVTRSTMASRRRIWTTRSAPGGALGRRPAALADLLRTLQLGLRRTGRAPERPGAHTALERRSRALGRIVRGPHG